MARRRSRSAEDGPWSLAQIAQAAGVSYTIVRTASRLGQIDRAALSWHDVLVVRAVDDLGPNPTSSRSGSGRGSERARARAAHRLAVAGAVRAALRGRYPGGVPNVGAVDDLWLLVVDGSPEPIEDLYGIAAKVAQAREVAAVLPLSRWVAELAADLTHPPEAAKPAPPAVPHPLAHEAGRTNSPAARQRTMNTTLLLELDHTLRAAAIAAAETMSRTPAQQIAHWARLGQRIEDDPGWSARDVAALLEGRARATCQPLPGPTND